MKRREFIKYGLGATAAAGFAGCSKIIVKGEHSPLAFDKKVPKPAGTMPVGELGSTGIKVSKFGFGSHMRREIIKYEKEREFMVREAYDLGVNFFDIYDYEQKCFQYEPMGRYLAPIINDVVISISLLRWDGRTFEQEFEHDLRLLKRDYIDMVRIHAWSENDPRFGKDWYIWEKLFKYKEQGKIRAVGVPIHKLADLKEPLENYPLDYVIFPYNFYNNWTWLNNELKFPEHQNYDELVTMLHSKGIGTVSMKPMASDNLVTPFRKLGAQFDESGEVNVAKASLKYIANSDLPIDSTIAGMYYPYHVYENIDAFFNPEMNDAERIVLKKIRNKAKIVAKHWLPSHYKFLEDWVPETYDDSDLFGRA